MLGCSWNAAEPCRAAAGELAPVGPRGSGSGCSCSHLPAALGLSQPRSLAAGPAVPGAGRPWAVGWGEWVFEGDGERQAGGSGAARSQGRSELIKLGKEETSGNLPAARGGLRGGMSGGHHPTVPHPSTSTRLGLGGHSPTWSGGRGDVHGCGFLACSPSVTCLCGLLVPLPKSFS